MEKKMAENLATLEIPREEWLDETPAGPRRPRRKTALWLFLGGVLLTGAAAAWKWYAPAAAPAFNAVEVKRGNLARTITATGKLQALTTVQVGTQVSGIISELHADFNSRVVKGQVIARLDPSQYEAQRAQAQASLESARSRIVSAQSNVANADAAVESALANVTRNDAALADAERNAKLTRDLVDAGVKPAMEVPPADSAVALASAQRQQAVAQLNQAKAQAQSARSQLDQARADARQSEAALDLVRVNLERTVIRAPIDGVVISRNVDIGQTVAASLQAPTIFLIANDLTQMQVLADIDEADVGSLGADSKVTFTVDAFPNDTFTGRISQIRLAPQTNQNVVTYTAVIDVANPDLKLKPGMTANVTATVAERHDVLQVPNAALRFRPQRNTVWRVEGGELTSVRVQTGMTDGIHTEITGGDLKEGDRLATAAPSTAPVQRRTTNPMMPAGPRRVR
jgi:HlyD family secretion protein